MKTAACDRYKWRCTIHEIPSIFQEHAMSWADVKRATRKGEIIDPAIHQFTRDECHRACLSNAGRVSSKKSHIGRPFAIYDHYSLACRLSLKTCRKHSGVTSYVKTHEQGEHIL